MHQRETGGVTITHVNSKLVALMTGQGNGWEQGEIDYEVQKFVSPPSPEIGKAENIIRPYIEAMARGGVTEAKALGLINDKDHRAGCIKCIVIEDTDLPSDRQSRDSWEWDDTTGQIIYSTS